jgi:hypothetical protein
MDSMSDEDVAIAYSSLGDLACHPKATITSDKLGETLRRLGQLYAKAAFTMDGQLFGPNLQSAAQLASAHTDSGGVRLLLRYYGVQLQGTTLKAASSRLKGCMLVPSGIPALDNLVKVPCLPPQPVGL